LKFFDGIAKQLGYVKSSRVSDIVGTNRNSFLYGDNQPGNFGQYLKSYADEAWVFICVRLIANTIAGTPWKIVKEVVRNGVVVQEPVWDSELYWLLRNVNEADPNSTWNSLMGFTVANTELTGNGYWLLDEIVGAEPKSILPLLSDRVTIKQGSGDKLIESYVYERKDGQKKPYPAEEILHFKYTNPGSYFYGQGAFSAGRMAVETHKGSVESNNNLFRQGSIGLQIYQTEQNLSAENFNRLRAQFKDNYSGKQTAHKFLILENGVKKAEGGATAKDLDFVNGQKLTREDICGVFGVPPILAGNLDKATYSNYKESEKIFWKSTILPKLQAYADTQTILAKRFSPEYVFVYDTSNIEALKDDFVSKADTAVKFFNIGIPLNQIIKKLELPFDEVEGGDVGYLSFSLQPIGSEKPEAIPDMTDKYEKRYKSIIAKYFTEIERGIIARLNARKSSLEGISKIDKSASYTDQEISGFLKTTADDIEYILFNADKEAKIFSNISIKVMRMALEEAGRRMLRDLGVSGNFDIYDPNVVNWLKKESASNAKDIMDSEREELRQILSDGYKRGLPQAEIEANIGNSFEGYKDKYKAERIARTEINASANKGRTEAMRDAGVKKKMWLTARDERVRSTHVEAGAQYEDGIPIDEEFVVGGHKCMEPGNTGVAEEDINCRCTVESVE
jgi:HK97 family phage portal protein